MAATPKPVRKATKLGVAAERAAGNRMSGKTSSKALKSLAKKATKAIKDDSGYEGAKTKSGKLKADGVFKGIGKEYSRNYKRAISGPAKSKDQVVKKTNPSFKKK